MEDFVSELKEFLDSETKDYSLAYEISPVDDDGVIEVVTWRYGDNEKCIHENTKNSTYWRWDAINKRLEMEVGEDSDRWEYVCFFDWQVKYFWMMVSPYLFSVN